MADDDNQADRSEAATPFKLERARKQGVVARGLDLGFFIALAITFAFATLRGLETTSPPLRAAQIAMLAAPQTIDSNAALLEMISNTANVFLSPFAVLIAALAAAVLFVELLQTRFLFSASAIKIDFSRLNPAKGLKRVFSPQLAIEAVKALVKLVAYSAIAWAAIAEILGSARPGGDAQVIAHYFWTTGLKLLLFATLVAGVVAILDQMIMRQLFARRMRMSRRDIRRESREREGDPRQKAHRKRQHAEFAQNARSLEGLKGADGLIVNPTRIAVALRYDRESMIAPTIVARGRLGFARRLKRMALIYGVPVIEDKALARTLIAIDLGSMIPESAYPDVVKFYRRIAAQPSRTTA